MMLRATAMRCDAAACRAGDAAIARLGQVGTDWSESLPVSLSASSPKQAAATALLR
jgi:hypothetical protein